MPDPTSYRPKPIPAANAATSAGTDDGAGILLEQLKTPSDDDVAAITHLWISTGLIPAIRDARKDIENCVNANHGSLIVARLPSDRQIIATMMTGHDEISGWIHYLAIAEFAQRLGLGRQLLDLAEDILRASNLAEVRVTIETPEIADFYAKLGYEPVTNAPQTKAHDVFQTTLMCKRLSP